MLLLEPQIDRASAGQIVLLDKTPEQLKACLHEVEATHGGIVNIGPLAGATVLCEHGRGTMMWANRTTAIILLDIGQTVPVGYSEVMCARYRTTP